MEFEALNAVDGEEGQRRYEEAGSPLIPSLVVAGRASPVMHPMQIATILGLPSPESEVDSARLAWDAASIMDGWIGLLQAAPWGALISPTPSRGRSIRNLTVNAFRPFEMLPDAWRAREFAWYTGEADTSRELPLTSPENLEDFARKVLRDWEDFLMEYGEDLKREDPEVRSSRGEVPYSVVLRAQRWHVAFHYRQILDFLRTQGIEPENVLDVEGFEDLDLPPSIY
ncbi:MAG: hypothetical protein ACR2JR_04005 [Rubrobacteraceae bacterium]